MKKFSVMLSLLTVMLFSVQLTHAQMAGNMDPHANEEGDEVVDASAQNPTEVDSKHYKVVFENEQVRVLRITYGSGEESVMHYHPDAVAILLTDNTVTFTLPDGKSIETVGKEGEAFWTPAVEHLPRNTGDKLMELILVELKNKPKTNSGSTRRY